MSAIAETVRSPSRVIITAQAATSGERDVLPGPAGEGQDRWAGQETGHTRGRPAEAGLVERTLIDLGITSPGTLQQGAERDRASVKVILDAAASEDRDRTRAAPMLTRPAGTADLVSHVLQAGDLRAAALLRSPVITSGPPRVPRPDGERLLGPGREEPVLDL